MKENKMTLKKFLPILSLCLILALLCGCKSKDAMSQSSIASLPQTQDAALGSAALSASDAVSIENADEEVALDPQNTVDVLPNGETVKITEVKPKSGVQNGIDVSKWQGKIDWKKVKASGVDFAIIRIGYRAENGKIYKDSYADYNIQQANKAGVLVGVYFFSTAVSTAEARKEAEWVYGNIKSYPISLPVAFDCEGFGNSSSRMYSLTMAARTDNALAFIRQIESYGYDSMFYSAKSDLESNWETARIENNTKIWVAHYGSITYPEIKNPQYNGKYDMWQYTNKGIVSGVSGDVDLVVSYFASSKKSPKVEGTVSEATAPSAADKTYTDVNENVTAKDIVNLRESAKTTSKIVGELKNGQILKRTAVGSNGWSKLTYNGKTVYAVSSYLTTDTSYKKPVVSSVTSSVSDGFTADSDKVTPKISVNLRKEPTTNSQVIATVNNGIVLNRIGKNTAKGWSKISYNGQTVYAVTSMLTTDLDYKDATQISSENSIDNGMHFYSVNEQVTAKNETNLRSKPVGGGGSEVLYTLKNGEFVTRTGYSDQGWSRLVWNGKTVYAVTSYLAVKGS